MLWNFLIVISKVSKSLKFKLFLSLGWGSHSASMSETPYLTAAASIGMTKNDIALFVKRLDKVLSDKTKKSAKSQETGRKTPTTSQIVDAMSMGRKTPTTAQIVDAMSLGRKTPTNVHQVENQINKTPTHDVTGRKTPTHDVLGRKTPTPKIGQSFESQAKKTPTHAAEAHGRKTPTQPGFDGQGRKTPTQPVFDGQGRKTPTQQALDGQGRKTPTQVLNNNHEIKGIQKMTQGSSQLQSTDV
jgi:hypothetical protein